jgi:hypothetical protein
VIKEESGDSRRYCNKVKLIKKHFMFDFSLNSFKFQILKMDSALPKRHSACLIVLVLTASMLMQLLPEVQAVVQLVDLPTAAAATNKTIEAAKPPPTKA